MQSRPIFSRSDRPKKSRNISVGIRNAVVIVAASSRKTRMKRSGASEKRIASNDPHIRGILHPGGRAPVANL